MQNNLSLLVDLYELTMAQSYFAYKKDTSATFDLFVRELPKNRAYLLACGLEDVNVICNNQSRLFFLRIYFRTRPFNQLQK